MFKILILVGKSPILLNLVPTNKRMYVPSSCMYHNIHSKAHMYFLLPTRTAYQDNIIMYLSNFKL